MSIRPPVLDPPHEGIADLTQRHVEEARDHNARVKKHSPLDFSQIPGHVAHVKPSSKSEKKSDSQEGKKKEDTKEGTEESQEKGKLPVYPEDHQVGMIVPRGGSDCDKCKYLAGPRKCGEQSFVQWNGSDRIPAATDEYCCDFFESKGTDSEQK